MMRFFDLENLPINQNDPDLIEIYKKSLNKNSDNVDNYKIPDHDNL